MVLDFHPHARRQMAGREFPEHAVYHLIGDHDEHIDRADGVTEYFGTWGGRDLLVAVRWRDADEDDGLVITAIDRNVRRRKRR